MKSDDQCNGGTCDLPDNRGYRSCPSGRGGGHCQGHDNSF